LNLKATLKAAHDNTVSSNETIGAFNAVYDTFNLHRHTSLRRPLKSTQIWWYQCSAAQVEFESKV
jgi:hypothetical protein